MQDLPHTPGTIIERTWAWLVLVLVLVLCGAVAAFNAAVDPTAQLGTGLVEAVSAGPRDRTAKVALLEAAGDAPLVVLGSSRTKKLDPLWLGAADGVNGAVVGGDSFEARVLGAWVLERDAAPRLVVGVDVEQFRDSSLQGSGFLDVPQLAAIARREASGSDGGVADELDRLEGLLLTWQVTKASVASLRARRGAAGDGAGEDERAESGFTVRGVPGADAQWDDPAAARRFALRTDGAVDRTIDELRATYRTTGADLDADAVTDLRALVRRARDAGGEPPLLYVTPAHPRFADALADEGRTQRRERVLDLLRGFERDGDAVVVDCSACIDDADTSWIDATHPSPLGARQLAEALRTELDGSTGAPDRGRS